MEWYQVLTIIAANVGVLLWMIRESNQDRRDFHALIREIRKDMADFHAQLLLLKERGK